MNRATSIQRIFLGIALSLALLVLRAPQHAAAHFPATDGNITAILHVEPDDYPPAGQPETIYFIFVDTSNKFRLANCSCNLLISQQGQELYYSSLLSPPSGQPTVYSTKGIPFTFASQATYQISLAGRPIPGSNFQPFNLKWNLQVGPAIKTGGDFSLPTFLLYFGLILAVLLAIGFVFFLAS